MFAIWVPRFEVTSDLRFGALRLSLRFESLAFVGGHISPEKKQNLVLVDPRVVALRFESRDWRSFVKYIRSMWNCGMACESRLRSLNASD